MSYIDLDLNLIKTFCVVYEEKGMLAASKKLYVSQPALTSSIKRLEEYLGGKLFLRTPKGLVPTAEGQEFYEYCQNATKNIDIGINKFMTKSIYDKGVLNIGSSSTIMRKVLLPFIEYFNKKYPKIVITVTDADSDRLQKLILRGELDLCILNTPIKNYEMFNITKITQTNDCFIASKDFEKDFLTKEELKNYPLILQKRPSTNRDYFEQICVSNDVHLKPSFELGSFGLITDFVAKKLGIAFTVENFVQDDIKNGRVKTIKTDLVFSPRDICTITSKASTSSIVCDEFIEQLKNYFA